MLQEANAELERAVSLSGGSPVYVASLAHAHGLARRRADALKLWTRLVVPKNVARRSRCESDPTASSPGRPQEGFHPGRVSSDCRAGQGAGFFRHINRL